MTCTYWWRQGTFAALRDVRGRVASRPWSGSWSGWRAGGTSLWPAVIPARACATTAAASPRCWKCASRSGGWSSSGRTPTPKTPPFSSSVSSRSRAPRVCDGDPSPIWSRATKMRGALDQACDDETRGDRSRAGRRRIGRCRGDPLSPPPGNRMCKFYS